MIVVVADTSPLSYFFRIKCAHVLAALFERVFVPSRPSAVLVDARRLMPRR